MQTDTLQNLCVREAFMTLCLEIISSVFKVKFNLPKPMGVRKDADRYPAKFMCERGFYDAVLISLL